jgi:DHA1 family bicyclomycin/chloramphenicol resistance-like MFS transporter
VTTAIAAVLGLYVGQAFDGTVTPLLVGFVAFGVTGLLIVLVTERGRLFGGGL